MSKLNLFLGSAIALSSPLALADNVNNYQSFAAFTGLINTPNAETVEKGHGIIGYNNQLAPSAFKARYSNDENGIRYVDGHNFKFSAGLFEGFEIQGMLAAYSIHTNKFIGRNSEIRDLSFNAKSKYLCHYISPFQYLVGH